MFETNVGFIPVFMATGIGFVIMNLFLARLLRPSSPTEKKIASYECGEEAIGSAWVQYNFRYYLFAIIFVAFDVEVLFFFPWAAIYNTMVLSGMGIFAFVEMMIFMVILSLALAYAWRKGALKWA